MGNNGKRGGCQAAAGLGHEGDVEQRYDSHHPVGEGEG
jgi:hypothetical protein